MSEHDQHTTLLGKVAVYMEILVKDPGSTIFVSLAEIYRKLGMYDDGRQILLAGLERHPDLSAAHIVMARILCQLGDFSGSATSFSRALELDSDSLAALVGFARVKMLGAQKEARDLLLRARTLYPADPVINKLLLSLPAQVAESEEGQVGVDATEEMPEGLASSTLADLYEKQGLTAKALVMYRQLSGDSPDNLTLRRKVRMLEANAAASVERAADSAQQDEIVETVAVTESVIDSTATMADSESARLTVTADVGGPAVGANQVVEELNRWLDNIRYRRAHV
jgi:tetratricopeptide (TPR) repeat protein